MLQSPHVGMPQWNGKRMVHAGAERREKKRFPHPPQRLDPRSHEAEKSTISETHANPLRTFRKVTLAVKPIQTISRHEWSYSRYITVQTNDHLRVEPTVP